MNYSEQLKSPLWQRKRLKIMERDNFTCQNCFSTQNQLQVHHKYYIKDKKAWEYYDESLITLCSQCHEDITKIKADIKSTIDYKFVKYDELIIVNDISSYYLNLAESEKELISDIFKSSFEKSLNL